MKTIDIKGLNLHIDTSVQAICETSNKSSSGTRSILYVLLIVNILALIAVANTHKYNWTTTRITYDQQEINRLNDSLMNGHHHAYKDSILMQNALNQKQRELDDNIRNQIENFQTVRIPILGNTFDVNNLSIVSGLTFLILIIFLRFTIAREISNLQIALNGISQRYTDEADADKFLHHEKFYADTNTKEEVLHAINFTRRQYHYNYLSMNEIFNMPPIEYGYWTIRSKTFRLVMKIFWVPALVYGIIVLNDFTTIKLALEKSDLHTIITICMSVLFLILISVYCHVCTKQKEDLYKHYAIFKYLDYNFNKSALSYLFLTHFYQFSPDKVYAACTNSQIVKKWMFDNNSGEIKMTMDVRKGGKFFITNPDDPETNYHGDYLDVNRGAKLSFTLTAPSLFEGVSTIILSFIHKHNNCELVLMQIGDGVLETKPYWMKLFRNLDMELKKTFNKK